SAAPLSKAPLRMEMLPIALSPASAHSSGMVSGPTSSQRSPGTPTSTAGPPGGPSPTVAGAEAWACAEAAAGGPPSAGGADAAPPAASAAPTATTRNSRPASATAPPRLDPESPARAAHGSASATEIKAVPRTPPHPARNAPGAHPAAVQPHPSALGLSPVPAAGHGSRGPARTA